MVILNTKYCDICDKEFFPTPEWAYQFWTKKGERKMFCSYKCTNIGKEKWKDRRKDRISDEVKRKM